MADHQLASGGDRHGKMGLTCGHSLHAAVLEILQIRNHDGRPYILIGGQAVNYWAGRYLLREAGLKRNISRSRAGH